MHVRCVRSYISRASFKSWSEHRYVRGMDPSIIEYFIGHSTATYVISKYSKYGKYDIAGGVNVNEM